MLSQNEIKCPDGLLNAARALPAVRTAIVNAGAYLPIASALEATREGLIEPVFFGDQVQIRHHAEKLDWDISVFQIIHADNEGHAAELAAKAAGSMDVASVMKGDIHSDVFLRMLLDKRWDLRTGRRLTHVFHMSMPDFDHPLLITDGAVNVAPDFKTKQSIVENAVNLAHQLGITRPNVAFLSATEEAIMSIPSSMEAAELAKWAKEHVKGAEFCGPLAFDLAVSHETARIKKFNNPVAGNADIIVVPEIVAGNALYKMMVYFMGACAAGIVLGAKVPIILTSRADPAASRLASAALASIISQSAKR